MASKKAPSQTKAIVLDPLGLPITRFCRAPICAPLGPHQVKRLPCRVSKAYLSTLDQSE